MLDKFKVINNKFIEYFILVKFYYIKVLLENWKCKIYANCVKLIWIQHKFQIFSTKCIEYTVKYEKSLY